MPCTFCTNYAMAIVVEMRLSYVVFVESDEQQESQSMRAVESDGENELKEGDD